MSASTVEHRSNGHDADHSGRVAEAECPFCGAPVSREEYRKILMRIEAEELARIAKVEQTLRDQFARQQKEAQTKAAAEVAKAKREAVRAAEIQIRAIRASQETLITQRVEKAREAAAKKTGEAVAAERVKHFEEKTRLTEQLAEMQRRLEQKSAHAIGEPAEADLFDALEKAFPQDRVWRVVRGQPGPDVVLEILSDGGIVGKIIVDSKAHARWSNRFVSKLKSDQRTEGADFAILASTTFPAGVQQLHIQDSIIIAAPQRVPVLIHLLRRQLVDSHRLKLGNEARDAKAEALFAYLTSRSCTDLFNQINKLADDMMDLDRTETAAHQKTWSRRADMIRGVQQVYDEFGAAVSRIIGATESADAEVVS
jgi:hypothetical protein